MRVEIMTDKLTSPSKESRLVGYWPHNATAETGVPVYHVDSIHELNRIVGYAKFINGSLGTVLYRGQTHDYGSLIPSGARPGKKAISPTVLTNICSDDRLLRFFQLNNPTIDGWKEYRQVIIESVIQHYGGNTYCMDFVDNHWCALWFGTYRFESNRYFCRNDDESNLFIYLYVADTYGASVRGMFLGEDTYTVDLRKAIPSTFQRPASQHGWIVRKKDTNTEECNYDDRVVGVIEVNVKQAKEWLGQGTLLSEENFFPSFDIDQGYSVLLQRQYRSGVSSTYSRILPQNTICNYHLQNTFFCSNREKEIYTTRHLIIDGKEVNSIEPLYYALVNNGWQKNTSMQSDSWDESKPWEFQSAPTALLVQRYFGGDIFIRKCLSRIHYYNVINDVIFDLTFQEVASIDPTTFFEHGENIGENPKTTLQNNTVLLNNLFSNCKIDDVIIQKKSTRYDKSNTKQRREKT